MANSPLDYSLTQQILQTADIVEIVSRYVELRKKGKDYVGLCPFHNDKHPSMYVVPAKQLFKCFSCGAGGDALKFIQLKENMTFLEARATLAEQLGIRIERTSGSGQFQRQDLTKIQTWAAQWFRNNLLGPKGQPTRDYVEKRGITAQTCETFQIGYAPEGWDGLLVAARRNGISDSHLLETGLIKERDNGSGFYDAFRNRLMFPILDVSGHVIAFGGRALDDNPAKYINSPETAVFSKSKTLYGLNVARNFAQPAKRVLVVEGYVDCVMCHQYGYGETVAVLGTALTDMHVQMLRRHVESVILVFDGDEAGHKAADRALEIVLNGQLDVRLAILPQGFDPADVLTGGAATKQTHGHLAENQPRTGKSALDAILASATDALEFRWQRFMQTFDAENENGPARRQATEAFLQFLAQVPALDSADAIARGMWGVRVAKVLGLEPRDIQQALRRMQRKPVRPAIDPDAAETDIPQEDDQNRAPDATQACLRQIIEVLLNEPAYYDQAQEAFAANTIADGDLAQVALVLQELCQTQLPWELTDLLGRLPEPRFGQLVTDLQLAGARRGELDRTLDGALQRLQHVAFLRETRRTVEQLKIRQRTGTIEGDAASVDDQLRKLSQEAGKHNHFAPSKWLSR